MSSVSLVVHCVYACILFAYLMQISTIEKCLLIYMYIHGNSVVISPSGGREWECTCILRVGIHPFE